VVVVAAAAVDAAVAEADVPHVTAAGAANSAAAPPNTPRRTPATTPVEPDARGHTDGERRQQGIPRAPRER